MKRTMLGALALAASLAAYPAAAAGVLFQLTHVDETYSWVLPQSPTPDYNDEIESDIDGPVLGKANGQPAAFFFFRFYTAEADGGLELDFFSGFSEQLSASSVFGGHLNLFGPQLFSGYTSAPTFEIGEYDLFDGGCGCGSIAQQAVGDYHLSIGAAVPEPATWALMIAGFGGAGVALRRQRRQLAA